MKLQVNVIMLACSKRNDLIEMTQNAIESLHKSEKEIEFIVTLVESYETVFNYRGVNRLLHPKTSFNYNAFMNLGLACSKESWVCLANNDVIFHAGWMAAMLDVAKADPVIQSFSPWCPEKWHFQENNYHIGYGIGGVVTGWCLVARREIFDIVKLDERVTFWCSDNVYEDALRGANIRHAIVRQSVVTHLGGKTLFSMDGKTIHNLTAGQVENYRKLNQ